MMNHNSSSNSSNANNASNRAWHIANHVSPARLTSDSFNVQQMTNAMSIIAHQTAKNDGSNDNDKDNLNLGTKVKHISAYLTDNFAPVKDEVDVSGLTSDDNVNFPLPSNLQGEFIRIGPNPYFDFAKEKQAYHWFDGDGMMHGCIINNGSLRYLNRYVQTERLKYDIQQGFSISDIAELTYANLSAAASVPNYEEDGTRMGKANTALSYHIPTRTLFALEEGDKPVIVNKSDLSTVGRTSFGGKLDHPVIAHPKIDSITGEMMMVGYVTKPEAPWAYYSVADKNGKLFRPPIPITLRSPCMIHDLIITEDYSIILDSPLTFSYERFMTGQSAYHCIQEWPMRYIFLPRHATSDAEAIVIDAPSTHVIFHHGNAWQNKDGSVTIYTCRSKIVNLEALQGDGAIDDKKQFFTGTNPDEVTQMWKMTFDLKNKTCTETLISDLNVEFSVVDFSRYGRKNRYIYAAHFTVNPKLPGTPAMNGIVKFDVDSGEIKTHLYPPGCWGGEASFAPASDRKNNFTDADEDNGYLVTYVYNENTGKSCLYIVNAKTMKLQSTVALPQRVPYGFHGIFISSNDY